MTTYRPQANPDPLVDRLPWKGLRALALALGILAGFITLGVASAQEAPQEAPGAFTIEAEDSVPFGLCLSIERAAYAANGLVCIPDGSPNRFAG